MKKKEKKEYILEYNMLTVNILSMVILVLMFGLTKLLLNVLPNTMINDLADRILELLVDGRNAGMFLLFFIVMILWMVLHEIIHSIAYQMKGANKYNIVYGVSLENGVFYCKCKQYINRSCIMFSLLAPFITIGVITYILGFIFNSVWLILLSIVNIMGASGDLMMFMFFLKQDKDVEFKEMGFSSPFCLRTSKDLTNKKYFGIKSIKLVEDPKETQEGYEDKITISKLSWIFIIVMFVILIIDAILLVIT